MILDFIQYIEIVEFIKSQQYARKKISIKNLFENIY